MNFLYRWYLEIYLEFWGIFVLLRIEIKILLNLNVHFFLIQCRFIVLQNCKNMMDILEITPLK